MKDPPKDMTADDLKPMKTFRWALSESQRQMVKQWMATIAKMQYQACSSLVLEDMAVVDGADTGSGSAGGAEIVPLKPTLAKQPKVLKKKSAEVFPS